MGKNIVICCDGTANQFGKHNTNVVKLYEMVILDDQQINFYDPGVGTSSRALLVPFRKLSNMLSQGLGLDLNRNVEDAYQFLMDHYEEGDAIYLFGFSRGAHTVRRLAHVLFRCGLLWRGSDNMIPYVLRMYNGNEEPEVIERFRNTYTRKCPVHFLGVWDTVSALSKILPLNRLDGKLSDEIKFAYHAVSIDEKRLQFRPNLFAKQIESDARKVEEVWFAGVHSDVGGYYDERGLSNTALKWMFEKAIAVGLREIPESLESIRTDASDKQHESWKGLFWFSPWHIHFLLVLFLILLVQFVIAYLGLFWNLPWRPFNSITKFMLENRLFVLPVLVLLVFATKKKRVIPADAKVHVSVKERWEKIPKYRPTNLAKVFESVKWVE